MSTEVDDYIAAAVHWSDEISALRPVLLGRGLTEEIKWGKPCYLHNGANIVILQEMKQFLAMMFFKGALLADPEGVLESQGPNSRSARRMCFASVEDVTGRAETIAAYIDAAIEVEQAGLEVGPPPEPELVDEFRVRLEADAELKTAFESLTPGRQREYHLYFSGAKQSSTRHARIDKCVPKILAGQGFRDR